MTSHPPKPTAGVLKDRWNDPVSKLVELPAPVLAPEAVERHTIFCLLVMALVARYWNGNKRGQEGKYPWRTKQAKPGGGYAGGDYLGHNIASIAVNGRGQILDFDFNHNEILNSSVEHAESRLVRRIFSLTQIYDLATAGLSTALVSIPYSNVLNDVTIYTSLESCSQCSGIMALGSVKEVVYLHRDPGQSSIGNILRNLSPVGERYRPPLPIPADLLGIKAFTDLDSAFENFRAQVGAKPFFEPLNGKLDKSGSITSFLCTDDAKDIFDSGKTALSSMPAVTYPDYRPAGDGGTVLEDARSNAEVLTHARHFLDYAVMMGRRGTPHQL